jgi:hypothetical protein
LADPADFNAWDRLNPATHNNNSNIFENRVEFL